MTSSESFYSDRYFNLSFMWEGNDTVIFFLFSQNYQIPQDNYQNYANAYLNWIKYLYPNLIGSVETQPYYFVPFYYYPTKPDAEVPVDEGSGGGPPIDIQPRRRRSILLRMIRK